MKYLLCFVVSLVCAMVLEQGQASTNIHETRFYKAEGRVDAGYLELAKDGTYRAIDREHMFVAVYEQGQWAQKGSVITFRPSTRMR